MQIPVHSGSARAVRRPLVVVALGCSLLLGGCVSGPQSSDTIGLQARPVQFSQGRVRVVLLDEYGIAMPGLRVDLSWQEPYFYKTSAFTNRNGEVTFSGVPQIAEVSVDHMGGNFTSAVIVPQTGQPEMRVMLDTRGGGELLRQQERERLAPRVPRTPPPPSAGQ